MYHANYQPASRVRQECWSTLARTQILFYRLYKSEFINRAPRKKLYNDPKFGCFNSYTVNNGTQIDKEIFRFLILEQIMKSPTD